jgi:hypothetical protein
MTPDAANRNHATVDAFDELRKRDQRVGGFGHGKVYETL